MNFINSLFNKFPTIRSYGREDEANQISAEVLNTMEYILSTIESSQKTQSNEAIKKFIQNSTYLKNIRDVYIDLSNTCSIHSPNMYYTRRHESKKSSSLSPNSYNLRGSHAVEELDNIHDDENFYDQDLNNKYLEINNGVNIEFNVWIHQSFFGDDKKLRMIFMLEDTLERLDLKCETYLNKTGGGLYQNQLIKCTTVVSIPFFIINSDKKIVYSYCFILMKSELEFIYENLLLELKKLRYIDYSLLNGIRDDFCNNNRKQHYLNFDGTALFGNIYYKDSKKILSSHKECIVNEITQLDANLQRKDLKEFYPHFLENLCQAYQCLCLDDMEYLNIFEKKIISAFDRTHKRLDHFHYKNESDYLIVLTMFFCTYRFNLTSKMKPSPKHWFNYIFQFHDCVCINILQSLKETFSYHINYLNEALEKFLRDNQATYQNPHGINALLLYYFINKEEISYTDSNNSKYKLSELMTKGAKEFPAKSNTKNDLSKFFEFHLPKKEFNIPSLKKFLKQFHNDSNFAALVLNYFGRENPDQLVGIYNDYNVTFLNRLHFLSVLITNKQKKHGQHLIDPKNRELFDLCTKLFVEQINNYIKIRDFYWSNEMFKQLIEEIHKSLSILTDALQDIPNEYEILRKLLEINLGYFQYVESSELQNSKQISIISDSFSYFLDIFTNLLNINTPIILTFGLTQDTLDQLDSKQFHSNKISKLLKSSNSRSLKSNDSELMLYKMLASIEFPLSTHGLNRKYQKRFRSHIVDKCLNKRLTESTLYELIITHRYGDLKIKDNIFFKNFEAQILRNLSEKNEKDAINILCNCLADRPEKLQWFIAELLKINWPGEDKILEFLLKDKILLDIYTWSFHFQLLNLEWKQHINKGLGILVDSINKAATGNLKIRTLKFFQSTSDTCLQIVRLMDNCVKRLDVKQDLLIKLFQHRFDEIEEFKKAKNSVQAFLQFCIPFKQYISIDTYSSKVKQLSRLDTNELILSEICKCELITDKKSSKENFTPQVTCFEEIGHKDFIKMEEINAMKHLQCVIFNSHFGQTCDELCQSGKLLSIRQVLDTVIPKTISKWRVLAMNINDGTIKLVEIDRILDRYFSGNYSKMLEELQYICQYFCIPNLKVRISQIERYKRFRSITEAAEQIDEIRRSLQLTNKFDELSTLMSVKSKEFGDWTIVKMDKEVENTIQILGRMDSPMKLECLKAFVKSMEFVKWLRQNTKDIKELKFLVDIASTGKEKVANNDLLAKALKEAGIAFAPLIFDLKVDTSFKEFMSRCEIVWSFLETDKNICDKLIFFEKDKIEQLENIRLHSSNVELSAINKAKQFNRKGHYTIGSFRKEFISSNGLVNLDQITNISNLIEFESELVNVQGNKTEKIISSYEDLKELQNILLLVARKDEIENDESDLEYFIEIFNNIVRLAQDYVSLLRSGCDLFEKFVTHVYCDIGGQRAKNGQTTLSFKIDQKFRSFAVMMMNTNGDFDNSCEETNACLKSLCKFLEACLESWQNHLLLLRNNYTYVNYFDINQIIYLRSNLGKLFYAEHSVNSEITDIDFSMIGYMLQNICSNVSKEKLEEVFNKTLSQRKKSSTTVPKMCESGIKSSHVEQTIKKIVHDNNFSIKVVRKAVEIYGVLNNDAIIEYCLENDTFEDCEDNKMELDEQILNMSIEKIPISSNENSQSTESTLQRQMRTVWSEFLKKQNGFSKNFLTTEHLATFLELLYDDTNSFQRLIPGYITNRGSPNLIICPAKYQISIVLSIYAHSPSHPLPSNDECLFCNPNTTSEQVENFFRIAFKSDGRRVYTLINIQDLTSINSQRVEKFLSTNTHVTQTSKYNLVCVCSQEKHDQSILATSLARYKIKAIIQPEDQIEAYLAPKFQVLSSSLGLSQYDFKKSTVRVLMSQRPGNGKSMYVKALRNRIKLKHTYKCIRIKTSSLDTDKELNKMLELRENTDKSRPILFHIDIAFEVFSNVDLFLFNLLIIGGLKHSNGLVWRREAKDIYIIEIMPPFLNTSRPTAFHSLLNYLPKINFRHPRAYLYDLMNLEAAELRQLHDNLFTEHYTEIKFQRSCFYLKIMRESPSDFARFSYTTRTEIDLPATLSQVDCLKILLDYSELTSPNWSELHSFVNFLDDQLDVLERTEFLRTIPDFKRVFTNLIIMMAYDFGLPSLNIGEESSAFNITENNQVQISINLLEISRKWENLYHPYIIFNADRKTFTFMGIYLDRKSYTFVNPNTGEQILLPELELKPNMRIALLTQRVPIFENFNNFPRTKKINSLRIVMGLDQPDQLGLDPDPSYQINLDTCLKLMAIYMRWRCNNPVVIMGETGCGKTRMVKFLSDLYLRTNLITAQHLIHVKVHGGTTAKEISVKVEMAEKLARTNRPKLFAASRFEGNDIPASVILFFDEANTTEAIGLIKEIISDRTCNGRDIEFSNGLKIIAAVNPYKKHSNEMIQKLEEAGLGFYMSANDTKEKIGHIPMRQLVYRVQPLPSSMLRDVWDFGQLDLATENVYILQLLEQSLKSNRHIHVESGEELKLIGKLLTSSQEFMRSRNDESSFVSLRDIERVIKVTEWFISLNELIFTRMSEKKIEGLEDDAYQTQLTVVRRAFVLALYVCYHAGLCSNSAKIEYRKLLAKIIPIKGYSSDWILCEIQKCQHVFLDEAKLKDNIAKNNALLENVLLMVISISLRIPLFIVGKPGSSKSLAKTIVSSLMEGKNSRSKFFKNLKETYFVNFQCSPLTTPEMIIESFREAANHQKDTDLEKSVAVVVLDEIGLAEGSETMPLKALHALLEEGTNSDGPALPHQKVGMIGISNWSLDPAKMNRGIFVSRGEPDINELIESARGICKYEDHVFGKIEPHIKDIAESYLLVCQQAREFKREFFGLRDYYSLIKMLYWLCLRDGRLTWHKLEHVVKRNFGGLNIEAVEIFRERMFSKLENRRTEKDPENTPVELIKAALKGENIESNSRYLLFITQNYSLIDMVQSYLINSLCVPIHRLVVIFGSSFRHDQEYTELVRNISRIKYNMELGNTVILLNCFNLFEPLYDALNQYYHEWAGARYVYLGLGTHRVRCCVHENFRLIIMAGKQAVYDSKLFPIPLLNRLEKQFLNAIDLIDNKQKALMDKVIAWINLFCQTSVTSRIKSKPNQVFIGFNEDTVATIILFLTQKDFSLEKTNDSKGNETMDHSGLDESYQIEKQEVLIKKIKRILLRCATADSIVRQSSSKFDSELQGEGLWEEYFQKEKHSSLRELLQNHMTQRNELDSDSSMNNNNLVQITTNSKNFLSNQDLASLAEHLNCEGSSCCILSTFETQFQFATHIKNFLQTESPNQVNRILIVQTEFTVRNSADIATARHTIVEQIKETLIKSNCFIILLINLTRDNLRHFNGFQIGYWTCYHIDEVSEEGDYLPSFDLLKGNSLSRILESNLISPRVLLKNIIHTSCSLIDDTNIERTIERIELFIRLCSCDDFVTAIMRRLTNLQVEKEKTIMSKEQTENWLIKEVADLRNIQHYSSMKRSCQNYFESKLSPLLAYLLAYVDYFSNLDILAEAQNNPDEQSWIKELWLKIFNDFNICKMSYSSLRTNSNHSEERKQFSCKSYLMKKRFDAQNADTKLVPNVPFSWHLINQLSDLHSSFMESRNAAFTFSNNATMPTSSLTTYLNTVPGQFTKTRIYLLISEVLSTHQKKSPLIKNCGQAFLDLYINDFVLLKCQIRTKKDLEIVNLAIKSLINSSKIDPSDLKLSLPLVHFEFEKIRHKISSYLKFSVFEPKLTNHIRSTCNFNDIDLESCLAAIRIFEETLQNSNINETINYINKLTQLVKVVISKFKDTTQVNQSDLFKQVLLKFNLLRVNYLFMENVLMPEYGHKPEVMQKLICSLSNMLKIKYLRNALASRGFETGCLENVHEFIGKCISKAKETLYRAHTQSKCCNKMLDSGYRLVLNADCECEECIVCETCELKMISMLNANRTVCLVCRQAIIIQADHSGEFSYLLEEIDQNRIPFSELVANLNIFYANVVDFLFSSDTKPDERTTETILRNITEGRIETITESRRQILDISSQYKSVILQKIFKNYCPIVKSHLNKWFTKCPPMFHHSNELAVFFQSCVYDDHFYKQTSMQSDDEQINFGIELCSELTVSKNSLRALFKETDTHYQVDYLVLIGKLKCCLEILACFCSCPERVDGLRKRESYEKFNSEMKKLLEEVNQETMFNYLIKILIRKYGSISLKLVKGNEETSWIAPNNIIGANLKVSDRYVLADSKEYNELKASMTKCFQENSANDFEVYIRQHADQAAILFPYLCMALYQNITLLYRDMPAVPYKIFEQILSTQYIHYKSYWEPLLTNSLSHKLKITKATWSHVELNLLLIQLKQSIIFSKSKLIKPLFDLINSPANAQGQFLPTMPHDSMFDIKNAIIAGNRNDSPKWYACPNGHPYCLFDCGRPWVLHTCEVCGAQTGGSQHKLLQGNTELSISDNTKRGYCLKDAGTMKDEASTERLLTSIQLSIIRFFLHACLYFSCDLHEGDLDRVMTDPPADKKEFFWSHMNLDLKIVCKILNINRDEALLLLHVICRDILKSHNNAKPDTWNTKEERQQWENTFSDAFLKPLLKDPNAVVNRAAKMLNSEKSQEEDQNNKVYFMAYERIENNKEQIYENDRFWRYIPNVNFNTLKIELNKSGQQEDHVILRKLVDLSDGLYLEANLQMMVKLINFLKETFHKSLFKHYAYKHSVRDVVSSKLLEKSKLSMTEIENAVECFQNVWLRVKNELLNYILKEIKVIQTYSSSDNDFSFSMDSKLSSFLPAIHGNGMNTYAMLHYLSSIHNEILFVYYNKKSIEFETIEITQFDNKENIIAFSEGTDLIQIIQSNFSFDSKSSRCEFRYEQITNQLIDRFLQSKPLVDMKKLFVFEYADEITSTFNNLQEIIAQENLNPSTQAEIFQNFKNVNHISEALNMLKTVINYGRATSAEPHEEVSGFLKKIYVEYSKRNFEQVLGSKINDVCQMKHLKHLSIILMLKKALLYTFEGQEPFENLNGHFKADSDFDMKFSFNSVVTISFGMLVYQLISSFLSTIFDKEIVQYSKYRIRDVLDSLVGSEELLLPDNLNALIEFIPEELEMKYIYVVWNKLAVFIRSNFAKSD